MNFGEWQHIYVTKENRVAVVWRTGKVNLSAGEPWTLEGFNARIEMKEGLKLEQST
jgi:hypothetical protein